MIAARRAKQVGHGRYLACICVLLALLAGCTSNVKAPVGQRSERPAVNPGTHLVQKGESLYSIAWMYGYDYQTLARWNGISAPYTIYVGQRIRVAAAPDPLVTDKSIVKTSPSAPPPKVVSKPAATPSPPPPSAPKVVAIKPAKPPARAAASPADSARPPGKWHWPAGGSLLRRFNSSAQGKKGIAIGGNTGEPVRATADGRVVYSGSGLVGYGRLIIVKHSKEFLSAYGHNQDLLFQEGDHVRAGQVIAHMGRSGTDRTMLHFEIRRNGKPVDPLRYLPKR